LKHAKTKKKQNNTKQYIIKIISILSERFRYNKIYDPTKHIKKKFDLNKRIKRKKEKNKRKNGGRIKNRNKTKKTCTNHTKHKPFY